MTYGAVTAWCGEFLDDVTGPHELDDAWQAWTAVERIVLLLQKTAIEALVRFQALARIEKAIKQPALIGPLEVFPRHPMGV